MSHSAQCSRFENLPLLPPFRKINRETALAEAPGLPARVEKTAPVRLRQPEPVLQYAEEGRSFAVQLPRGLLGSDHPAPEEQALVTLPRQHFERLVQTKLLAQGNVE